MADGSVAGERAQFREMLEGTQEDWNIIAEHSRIFNKGLAKRVLDHLRLLDGDYGGFPVDRLEHSLQTATRAHRDGRDDIGLAFGLGTDARSVKCCFLSARN